MGLEIKKGKPQNIQNNKYVKKHYVDGTEQCLL